MTHIIDFPGWTRINSDPNKALEKAMHADLDSVLILGFDKQGNEYTHTSIACGGDVLWLLERAKYKMLSVTDEWLEGA